MTGDGHHIDRRTVLRDLLAGGTIVGATGLASGGTTTAGRQGADVASELEREFGDVETVEGFFETYGEPVRDALVERGYLSPDATVSIESVVSRHEYSLGEESDVAAVSTGRRDGTEVMDVRIRQRTVDHVIEYHLHPGIDDGYAEVRLDDDRSALVFPDGTVDDVTTSSCCPDECIDLGCPGLRCTDDYCDCQDGYNYYYEEILCCTLNSDDECVCSWETHDCDCPEYYYICPE